MSNSTNVTKQVETTAPYTSSTNANLLACMVNTSINGVSPTSQPIVSRSLDSTDYTNLVQAKQQDGIFTSKTDKKIFTIDSNLDFEFNPIKSLESNIGIAYNYVSNLAAEDKDNRVQKDNIPASPYPSYGPEIYSGTNSNSPDVFIATPARNPPCIISESRTGTASYTQINERGVFSEGKEVEIRVLTSPNNYSFGTSQNFDQIEPRGSQTPQRYYNHNSGRTLSFVAEFHQQEYPLEPLLSIAEKAQYLARPYKHGDYALIPKLVMVQIPGRVFRGYLQSVSINTSGDDYSNWNFIDIKSKVGTMGEQEGFYGGYNSRELEPIGGISNDRKDIMTDNQNVYYGLSKMTIDFTLLIVEDIVLTTYETQEEIAERERIQQEEAERLIKEAERQIAIDQARGYVELHKSVMDGTYIDDCIYVDPKTGEIIGVKFIDSDENEIDTTNGREGITLTEWERQQEIKKGDTVKQPEQSQYIDPPTQDMWDIMSRGADIDTMLDYFTSEYKKQHPDATSEQVQEYRDRLKEETQERGIDWLFDQYKDSVVDNGIAKDNENLAFFFDSSVSENTLGDQVFGISMDVDPRLKGFLTTPINDFEGVQKALKSICVDKGENHEIDFELMKVNENGDTSDGYTADWSILIEICGEIGLDIDWDCFTGEKNRWGFRSATTKNSVVSCGFRLDDDFPLDDKYKELLIENDLAISMTAMPLVSYYVFSFERIAKLSAEKVALLTLIDPVSKKEDKTLYNFIVSSIKELRDAFYKGFEKVCKEKLNPKVGQPLNDSSSSEVVHIFASKKNCESYLKNFARQNNLYFESYWWQYDT